MEMEYLATTPRVQGREHIVSVVEIPVLETSRLQLRAFTDDDRPLYAAMRADPDVIRYLPGGEALVPFADEIAVSRLKRFREGWSRGFGIWAVEDRETRGFVGYCGLDAGGSRSQDVEVLYGFARAHWGKGYAREAASAALVFGFERLHLPRIVGFAVAKNGASRRVLEAIGLAFQGEVDYAGFPVMAFGREREVWMKERSAAGTGAGAGSGQINDMEVRPEDPPSR